MVRTSPRASRPLSQQIERQISGIAEKLDAAEHRSGDLGAIERGIQQLTLQVREAREEAVITAERVARQVAADIAPQGGMEVTALKRDIESLHVNQSESEQRTHETLEAVHDTLERLVERLATVETGIRSEPQAAAHAPQPRRLHGAHRTPGTGDAGHPRDAGGRAGRARTGA